MKLVFVTFFVLAVSLGSATRIPGPVSTFGLKEDIDDFIALIPREKILNIVISYLAVDEEVQQTLQYILSDDFKQLILDLEAIPEYKQFLAYLQSHGLNVYYYISELHKFIGMDDFKPKHFLRSLRRKPGVRGMLDEIEAVLPEKKFQEMFEYKMKNSPAFANLIAQMRSDDFKEIIAEMRANPELIDLLKTAQERGIDIEKLNDILKKIFGW